MCIRDSIKALEENGIGRPSTYAPIITTLIDRGYVERDQKKLKPTLLGRAVDGLMLEQFPLSLIHILTIMTIHRSKGLQFPVVFVGDTARHFNLSDTYQDVYKRQVLGFLISSDIDIVSCIVS